MESVITVLLATRNTNDRHFVFSTAAHPTPRSSWAQMPRALCHPDHGTGSVYCPPLSRARKPRHRGVIEFARSHKVSGEGGTFKRCFAPWQRAATACAVISPPGSQRSPPPPGGAVGWGAGSALPGSRSRGAPCSRRHTGCDSSHWGTCRGSAQNTAEHR